MEYSYDMSKKDDKTVPELRNTVHDLEEKEEIMSSCKQEHYKSVMFTVLLASCVGVILLGVGHLYVGQKKSGTAWFVGGLFISIPTVLLYIMTSGNYWASIFLGFLYFILWTSQILSAVSYCKQWNAEITIRIYFRSNLNLNLDTKNNKHL